MKRIKKASVILFLMVTALVMNAQNRVDVRIFNIQSESVTKKMEKSSSEVLSAINRAYNTKTVPSFNPVSITEGGVKDILTLWEVYGHCFSLDAEIASKGFHLKNGYKIRNVTMRFFLETGEVKTENISLSFDTTGKVSGFNMGLDQKFMANLIPDATHNDVIDIRQRELIVEVIEQFRTAYNRKDIGFLQRIYSDDALIITGKVIKQDIGSDGIQLSDGDAVLYQEQTKKEYIKKLENIFDANKYINIGFDQIHIRQHPGIKEIYGVTLFQSWTTSGYSDEGWVFLIFDFKDPDKPIIHIRTWQPEIVGRDGVFQLGDFYIQK